MVRFNKGRSDVEPLRTGFLIRGVEIVSERPTAFFLGGSFMESMFHEEERRFVAQLARRLPINVVNGGYSGTTTMRMTTMLIAMIGGLAKPGDVIVASLPMSDLVAATSKGSYWTDVRSHAMLKPPLKSQFEPCILHTRAALEAMAAFCGPMGLKFVLMTGPRRQSDFNTESWSRNIYRRRRGAWERAHIAHLELNEAARGFARASGVELIDTDVEFSSCSEFFMIIFIFI